MAIWYMVHLTMLIGLHFFSDDFTASCNVLSQNCLMLNRGIMIHTWVSFHLFKSKLFVLFNVGIILFFTVSIWAGSKYIYRFLSNLSLIETQNNFCIIEVSIHSHLIIIILQTGSQNTFINDRFTFCIVFLDTRQHVVDGNYFR